MTKNFTDAEKALLDDDVKTLDVIQKKQRQRLQARVYIEKYLNKQKEIKGIEQYKQDKNNKMKEYRKSEKKLSIGKM